MAKILYLLQLTVMHVTGAFVLEQATPLSSSQLNSHSKDETTTELFVSANWEKKLDEWSDALKNYDMSEALKAGSSIGSFFRDVVVDDWAKPWLQQALAPTTEFPTAANEFQPSTLDLELRRSNRRLFHKSLQQQLLEAEADLANLQARMAHPEPISYFE